MYTTPRITHSKTGRSYVTFTFNGKRYREYNANRLRLDIYPNRADDPKDQKRLLEHLQFEFKKALGQGWNPEHVNIEKPAIAVAFDEILKEKKEDNLSALYIRNLVGIHRMFLEYLGKAASHLTVDDLTLPLIENFLSRFRTSERNYINRRIQLGTFLRECLRKKYSSINIITETLPARAKAVLHIPYEKRELRTCLEYLAATNQNLHLCCLLTYSCLLRPHQEIRGLRRKHFFNDFTEIRLSGSENKSKRIRTVYVPDYVTPILRARLNGVSEPETNIFTLSKNLFSAGYFNLMWGKLKPKMLDLGIIRKYHTIYSFRHTAAIDVYRKTKDLHLLQQLLQHSTMIVTLNYLRGLGEINDERLKDVMPTL